MSTRSTARREEPVYVREEVAWLPYLMCRASDLAQAIPHWLIALVARLAIAPVFWLSAQTKVVSAPLFTLFGKEVGWPTALFPPEMQASTVLLFAEEYKLPLIPPEVAAWMAAGAELVLPLLLVVGLLTRLSALGLLVMTLMIQLFVYPGLWTDHLLWSAVLLFLVARGPGCLSLDALIIWVRRYHT